MTPTVPSVLIRKTYVVSTSANFFQINTEFCGDNFKFSLVKQGYSTKICSVKNFVFTRGGVEDTMLEAKDTKKCEAKVKDCLSEDRHSRGQGQECSRPRPRTKDTSASALRKKKRSSEKFFRRSPQKNVFQNIFQALHKILTNQKIVLSSSRGQANFRGLEAPRPRT